MGDREFAGIWYLQGNKVHKMSLTTAIAILKRQDAQVKVNVPASGHHKAYSYYKEGSGKGGAIVRGVALGIGGTLAGGALTAALLARKKAKSGEEATDPKGLLKGSNAIDVESREVSNGISGSRMKSALPQGKDRGKTLITPPPTNSSSRVLVTPTPLKSISQMVKEGVGTPSPSKQNAQLANDKSENLLIKGIKSLRKVKNAEAKTSEQEGSQPKNQSAYPPKRQGIVDKGFAAIRNMVKEGGDRHNKAVKSLSKKEIDLNKASYTAGEKTRIAAHNTATFAKAYAQTFGKKQPQTIDVKASEVKEPPESLTLSKQSQSKKKSKRNAPTAAKKRSTQKQLDDLNK